jgi:hypothetical protein
MGTWLGGTVFACPGTFSMINTGQSGGASALCAAMNVPCGATMLTNINVPLCQTLSGYFASAVDAEVGFTDPTSAAMCGPQGNMQVRQIVGCGHTVNGIYTLKTACSGLPQALDCRLNQPPSGWACMYPGTTLDSVSNSNATDGVLCCHM